MGVFLICTIMILASSKHCLADTSFCEPSSQDAHCSNETEYSYFIQLLIEEGYRNISKESVVGIIWAWLVEYQAWILSILGSAVVGLSGIFPLLVIPIEEGANLKTGAAASTLRVLLSFAVGGLLGDVFLHLLPEAWAAERPLVTEPPAPGTRPPRPSMVAGMWVLAGILLFTVLEMMCPDHEEAEEETPVIDTNTNNNVAANGALHHNGSSSKNVTLSNGSVTHFNGSASHVKNYQNGLVPHSNASSKVKNGDCNGHSDLLKNGDTNVHSEHLTNGDTNGHSKLANGTTDQARRTSKCDTSTRKVPMKQVAGYLNLLANSIDNFMHGLAVGGGFLVSFKMGALTTLVILIHEVPHEIGDFAILLRAGFSRWDAAKAQLYTAGSGLLGALTAVACSSSNVESRTSWVVPFTAGGFLHIALVTVLPELLAERDKWESAKQLAGLITGMLVMAVLTACFE